MITSWEDFEEWRRLGLLYHYGNRYRYLNALNFFEYARRYFQKNGFPEDNRAIVKSGVNKGKKKPWSDKEKKEQQEEIRNFIKEGRKTRKRRK